MICASLGYTKMGISSTSFLEKTVNSHLSYIVLDLENEIVLLSACLSWCCSLQVHTSFSIAGHFHSFYTKYLFVFLCHFSLFTVFAHPCAEVRWIYQSVDASKITWKLSLKTSSSFEWLDVSSTFLFLSVFSKFQCCIYLHLTIRFFV
jgi:hypothetical protein